MTGLVSRPPLRDTVPHQAPPPELVTGDGWWPDVDIAALRQVARIDTTVTPVRLREAAIGAMLSVNDQLADWRAPHEAAGAESLLDVAAPLIDGQSRLVFLYSRAVYALTAADLCETLKDVSATAAGMDRAEELASPADEHRRKADWAIADIMGRPRTIAELI